jgi:hypothetical protein
MVARSRRVIYDNIIRDRAADGGFSILELIRLRVAVWSVNDKIPHT